uniref:Uncharacterized protein n=1 Tax=Mesocestoides corti TaxID=53468 RepID=A0A5K3EGI4_MESCO
MLLTGDRPPPPMFRPPFSRDQSARSNPVCNTSGSLRSRTGRVVAISHSALLLTTAKATFSFPSSTASPHRSAEIAEEESRTKTPLPAH